MFNHLHDHLKATSLVQFIFYGKEEGGKKKEKKEGGKQQTLNPWTEAGAIRA